MKSLKLYRTYYKYERQKMLIMVSNNDWENDTAVIAEGTNVELHCVPQKNM